MFGFSGGEILLIVLIALILFGNDKLPENMKKMVKGLNQAKKVAKDVQVSWQDVKSDVQRSINFEEERQEVRALIQSASMDFDEQIGDTSPPILPNFSLSQQDIDEFNDNLGSQNIQNAMMDQTFHDFQEEVVNKIEYLSANDFIMSSEFVGPRA